MKFKIWSTVAFVAMFGAGLQAAPTVSGVTRSVIDPKPSQAVTLTAEVAGATSVKLFVDSSYNSTTGAGTAGFTEYAMVNSGGNDWTYTFPASTFADKTYIKWYVEAVDGTGTTRFPAGSVNNVFSLYETPVSPNDILITEMIMDSAGSNNGSGAADGTEWVEIRNTTGQEIDLSHYRIGNYLATGNAKIIDQGTKLPPNSYMIFAGRKDKFTSIYPTVDPNMVYNMGWTSAVLSNAGDHAEAFGPTGNTIVIATPNQYYGTGVSTSTYFYEPSTLPLKNIKYLNGLYPWPGWQSPSSNDFSFSFSQIASTDAANKDGKNWYIGPATPGAGNVVVYDAGPDDSNILPNTNVPFSAKVAGGATAVKVYYDATNSGAFSSSVNLTYSGSGHEWTGTIPGSGFADKTTVNWYVEATVGSQTIYLPYNAKRDPAYTRHQAFLVDAAPMVPGDIVINEIIPDPQSGDNSTHAEFIEFYNPTSTPKDVSGLVLTRSRATLMSTEMIDGKPYTGIISPNVPAIVPPNGYFVVAPNKSLFMSKYTDVDPSLVGEFAYQYTQSTYVNNGGVLSLYRPWEGVRANQAEKIEPEFIYAPSGDTSWPTAAASHSHSPQNGGPSWELINPLLPRGVGSSWKVAEEFTYDGRKRGTPTRQNSTFSNDIGIQIVNVSRNIQYPKSSDTIEISATINSGASITSAQVFVDSGSGTFTPVAMTGTMTGPISNGVFTANIGTFADKTYVKYYVRLQDSGGKVSLYPADAPTDFNVFLVEDVTSVVSSSIVINELQFDPQSNDNSTNSEWIEIYNRTNQPLDLSYFVFSPVANISSNRVVFPAGTIIQPNDFIIFAGNQAVFDQEFAGSPFTFGPNQVVYANWSVSTMSNGTNTISLRHVNAWGYTGTAGNPLDTITYNQGGTGGWPGNGNASPSNAANNTGFTLELKAPHLDNNNGNNWSVSSVRKGTPGKHNTNYHPVTLSVGRDIMYPTSSQAFKFTATATATYSPNTVTNVTLFLSTDGGNNYTPYVMTNTGGNDYETVSVGPYADGTIIHFYVEATASNGDKEQYPQLYVEPALNVVIGSAVIYPGDIVINEIAYDTFNSDNSEFIELYNRTSNPINISYLRVGDNQENYYSIPNGTTLAPNGYVVVAQNYSWFTSSYPVVGQVFYHEYMFNLANGGDTVRIIHPNEYRFNNTNNPIDEVTYDITSPWPTWSAAPDNTAPDSPNKSGRSIELINPNFADRGTNGARWAWTTKIVSNDEFLMSAGTPGEVNSVYSNASVNDWTLY